MTNIEIKLSTAKKLEDIVQQTDKTVDEILDLLLTQYQHTLVIAGEVHETEDVTWTDEEIAELLRPKPLTGKEMIEQGFFGGWEHKNIDDPVTFLKQQRANRRKNKFT
ncbi:MAG: hypothetical protein AAF846_21915 [Chloroflexota bacterium]